ncbi:MAG: hypothetical protein ABR915_09110 [Thermoguttaceae bacterium]|jgi:hypothetical protein
MAFKAEIRASIGWNWSQGAVDNSRLDYTRLLAEGYGDGQAEAAWHDDGQTLLEGAVDVLDLTALPREVLGSVLTTTLLRVKAILVVNDAGSAGTLVVGGAGGAEWSAPFGADGDTVEVPPDGAMLLASRMSGWPVDDAHKLLKLTARGGDVSCRIALVGTLTAAGSGSSGA